MKGGSPCNLRVKKLYITPIALIFLIFVVWAWEKTPPDQFNMSVTVIYPVIPIRTPVISSSVEIHERSPVTEIPSEPPTENNSSTCIKSEQAPIIPPIGDQKKNSFEVTKSSSNIEMVTSDKKECNYAKGKWVADSRRPIYSGLGCKRWLSGMWSCRLNHRTDFSFENYRWQPKDCEMPEFEGSKFLTRMQHKTIAFVGDSLGRQQFQSLICMVTAGKDNPKVEDVGKQYGLIKAPGSIRPDGWAYRFPETNTTILYYWSATLCKLEPLNETDSSAYSAMHLDRPAKFVKDYINKFDVLVLNTGHHWNRGKFDGNGWTMYLNGMPYTDTIGNAKIFAVHSIAKWVDSQVWKYPRLKVFFRTLSPRNFDKGEWNSGGRCENTKPLARGSEVTQDGSIDKVTEDAVKGTRVKLLDISGLSQLRDEGHMSNYSIRAAPGRHDCLHWCLPGIPDTWNELLAAQV